LIILQMNLVHHWLKRRFFLYKNVLRAIGIKLLQLSVFYLRHYASIRVDVFIFHPIYY
jgi:hypothetical protein